MRKKYVIFIVIFALIFLFFYYKNQKLGNTIIKFNEDKIIENILNGEINYKATIKVKVYSNKNENEYLLKIIENGKDNSMEAISNNISGLKIEKKNGDLILKNTKMKLDKIYENYKEITDNSLFLSSFAKDYNKSAKKTKEEKDGEIQIKITLKDYNKYIKYKELYLNKETGIPTKLVIKDSSNNPKVIIEYTSIEIL